MSFECQNFLFKFNPFYSYPRETLQIHPCNSTITTRTGYITSPGYPESYPPSVKCTWIINVPSDYIKGKTVFFHKSHEFITETTHDYLEIAYPGSGKLYKTSGIQNFYYYYILNNSLPLKLKFVSDHSVHKKGFKIAFNFANIGNLILIAYFMINIYIF